MSEDYGITFGVVNTMRSLLRRHRAEIERIPVGEVRLCWSENGKVVLRVTQSFPPGRGAPTKEPVEFA